MANHTVNYRKPVVGGLHGFLPLIKGESKRGLSQSQPVPVPQSHLSGYSLAGALVLIGVMSIMMAVSLPIWERVKQRENEEELIFRGKEYTEAIGRYHAKFNSFPPDLETLYKMKFIRRLYKDPMTEEGEWKVLHPDSLVEAGEAGFINQPGSKKQPGEEEKEGDDGKEKREEGVIPGLKNPAKEKRTKQETTQDGEEISIGPVVGVVSQSKKESLRILNGHTTYDKWVFVYVPQQAPQPPQPGGPKVPDKGGKKPPTQTQPTGTPDRN